MTKWLQTLNLEGHGVALEPLRASHVPELEAVLVEGGFEACLGATQSAASV